MSSQNAMKKLEHKLRQLAEKWLDDGSGGNKVAPELMGALKEAYDMGRREGFSQGSDATALAAKSLAIHHLDQIKSL